MSEASSKPRVLIVEDNLQNQKLARHILRINGYDAEVACSGEEGVALAREMSFDLVLMDIQLPGMDGLEATRELKGFPGTCHVPVLALTAFAHSSDREQAFAAGCDGYVTKPYGMSDLLTAIRQLLTADCAAAVGE